MTPTGCTSAPLNRRGKILIAIAGLCLLVPLCLRVSGRTPALLWEGLTFAFGCVFLWLSLRYLFVRYRYEIDQTTDGRWFLFVACIKGKRSVEQARLPLEDFRYVGFFSEKEAASAAALPKSAPLHRYHAQLFPDRLLYLVFESAGETITLTLDADETFADALAAFAADGI